jgi:hypothetical protein
MNQCGTHVGGRLMDGDCGTLRGILGAHRLLGVETFPVFLTKSCIPVTCGAESGAVDDTPPALTLLVKFTAGLAMARKRSTSLYHALQDKYHGLTVILDDDSVVMDWWEHPWVEEFEASQCGLLCSNPCRF